MVPLQDIDNKLFVGSQLAALALDAAADEELLLELQEPNR